MSTWGVCSELARRPHRGPGPGQRPPARRRRGPVAQARRHQREPGGRVQRRGRAVGAARHRPAGAGPGPGGRRGHGRGRPGRPSPRLPPGAGAEQVRGAGDGRLRAADLRRPVRPGHAGGSRRLPPGNARSPPQPGGSACGPPRPAHRPAAQGRHRGRRRPRGGRAGPGLRPRSAGLGGQRGGGGAGRARDVQPPDAAGVDPLQPHRRPRRRRRRDPAPPGRRGGTRQHLAQLVAGARRRRPAPVRRPGRGHG